MRKIFLLLIIIASFSNAKAQMVIDQTLTPTQLVDDVLLGGGIMAFNVTYTKGQPDQIGKFSGTQNSGLSSGIIMGTGKLVNPPFESVNEPHEWYGYYALEPPYPPNYVVGKGFLVEDADLVELSNLDELGGPNDHSYDACVLEFDFVPLGDTVKFRYVFGSDEYPDFVCAEFNDVFGFFISGPGITGPYEDNAINIALIPETTIPISINSVNDGNPAGSAASCILDNDEYYVENNGTTIAFYGMTVVLTAWAKVIACDTFHIKLAISDVGDGSRGSGVFLEEKSFFSNGTSTSLEYTQPAAGSFAIEGCSDAILHFNLGTPTTSPLTINYTVGGTAASGTDYTPIPTSITIPTGASTGSINIHPLTDGSSEGIETVLIILESFSPCGAVSDTIRIYINDNTPLNINLTSDTTICPTNPATLTATVSGGLGPYIYAWSNSASSSSTTVSPLSTTAYTLTVSDFCGQTDIDTVVVTVSAELNVEVDDVTICPGQSATLIPSGASSYAWSVGISGSNPGTTPPLTTTTTYTVTGTSSGCSGSASVTVNIDNFQGDFSSSFPIPGNLVTVLFTDLTIGSVQWHWDFGNSSTSTLQNPTISYETPGTYLVTLIVTNATGCKDTISKNVDIFPPLDIQIPNVFSPNADGINDVFGPVLAGFESFHMEIYNRWGKLVFVTDNYDALWNGSINNNPAAEGVYYFIITIGKYGLEDDYTAKGSVTLLR